MDFNSILKIFLPKDRVFYQLFEVVAAELVKMGEALKEVVHEPDFEKRAVLIKKIEDMMTGSVPFTMILEDPLSNSFLQNPYHPEEDKNVKVVIR